MLRAMRKAESGRLPRWPFILDTDKVIEAVLFITPRIERPTLHSIAKVLFHADKMHLSRYGRPISGDRYVAMKFGPVPSATYDILKAVRGDSFFSLPERAQNAFRVDNFDVEALRPADVSVLSGSEIECLVASASEHGAKTFKQRSAESHGPAWQAVGENDVIELENLLLEIENRDELREHFAHEDS
jgi:uncharacterized phage-associated protein